MNTTEKNQQVIIEGFNHGQCIELDVHSIDRVSGEWYGKVYVNVYGLQREFVVMFQPSKGIWECSLDSLTR